MKANGRRASVRVTVPGKIMLAGEYTVLQGGKCLSATVAARLTLDVSESEAFVVRSDLWSEDILIDDSPSSEALINSLQFSAKDCALTQALVEVRSDLPVAFGLGSSSAVRLAAHLGLKAFTRQQIDLSPADIWQCAHEGWRLQREQQGFASGYDLVTQLQGGYMEWSPDYSQWPGQIRPLALSWLKEWVHPYAGGSGAPTAKVGDSVRRWLDHGALWQELALRTQTLIEAFLKGELSALIQANQAHRECFHTAPFYPHDLYNLLASLAGFDRSWTFKTTGAGGEDTILLIGRKEHLLVADQELRRKGWQALSSPWSDQGTCISWKDQRS